MGNGKLTSDINAYELPGVPWVAFFVDTGVAFHGTFWHDNYGNEMSHGCVNMRPEEAKWLYRWLTPIADPGKMVNGGKGTKVIVT
jgi:lipoprotein-anchoring transpeptidase ErfK/SrfK